MDCFECPYLSSYEFIGEFGIVYEREGCCRVTNECPFDNEDEEIDLFPP